MRVCRQAAVAVLMLTTTAQAAQLSATGPVIYHCTNPASGANWDISIDMDRHVADSYPARIGARQITWRDASDAGNYDLDRATGRLTVVRASSTGGYTIFDACVAGR